MSWVLAAVVLAMLVVSVYTLRQRSRRSLDPADRTDPQLARRLEAQQAERGSDANLGRNGQSPGGFGGGLGGS